jgi:hypothetical protein
MKLVNFLLANLAQGRRKAGHKKVIHRKDREFLLLYTY